MFEISAKQTFYFRIQSYQHLNNFKHSWSSDKANKNKNNSKTNPLSIVIESMKKKVNGHIYFEHKCCSQEWEFLKFLGGNHLEIADDIFCIACKKCWFYSEALFNDNQN